MTTTNRVRVIVYEYRDGSEEVFEIDSIEMERHERAVAEHELHSRDTTMVGFHFEYRDRSEVRK